MGSHNLRAKVVKNAGPSGPKLATTPVVLRHQFFHSLSNMPLPNEHFQLSACNLQPLFCHHALGLAFGARAVLSNAASSLQKPQR